MAIIKLSDNGLRLMAGRNRRLEDSGQPLGAVSCVRWIVRRPVLFY